MPPFFYCKGQRDVAEAEAEIMIPTFGGSFALFAPRFGWVERHNPLPIYDSNYALRRATFSEYVPSVDFRLSEDSKTVREMYVEGASVLTFGPIERENFAVAVLDSLGRMASEVPIPKSVLASRERLVIAQSMIDDFPEQCGGIKLENVERILDSSPAVCSHGDLIPRNVVVQDGELFCVDFDSIAIRSVLDDALSVCSWVPDSFRAGAFDKQLLALAQDSPLGEMSANSRRSHLAFIYGLFGASSEATVLQGKTEEVNVKDLQHRFLRFQQRLWPRPN